MTFYCLIGFVDIQEEISLQMASSNQKIAKLEDNLERAQAQLQTQKVQHI